MRKKIYMIHFVDLKFDRLSLRIYESFQKWHVLFLFVYKKNPHFLKVRQTLNFRFENSYLHYLINHYYNKMSLGHVLKEGIFVVAAKRTPFGAFGGSLKNFSPTDLQALAFAGALKAGNIKPEAIGKFFIKQ